jgi:hypothetical protein
VPGINGGNNDGLSSDVSFKEIATGDPMIDKDLVDLRHQILLQLDVILQEQKEVNEVNVDL